MFEGFTFDTKVNSSTVTDDDLQLSPKCMAYPCSSHTITPTAPPCNPEGDRIETLVHQMSKQTLIPNLQCGFELNADHSEVRSKASIQQAQVPAQIRESTEHPIQFDSNQQLAEPLIDNQPTSLHTQQQQDHRQERIAGTDGPVTEDTASFRNRILDGKRSRQQSEARLRNNSSSNPRTLDLMTNMIENGEQCNVQTSASGPPLVARQPSSSFAPFIEPDDNVNQQPLDGDNMDLEVDSGCGDPSEESPSRDSQALRHAGTPAGIRKAGFLRYRTSAEVALQCKNMKRSVPRMRRRPKIKPPS
ncbi:hypothetical protein F5B20DRAFT_132080 [Whalleya microplaca]|nr:hypothetical protein F5B20DRAFT_132080 [Whalleya microplaca]